MSLKQHGASRVTLLSFRYLEPRCNVKYNVPRAAACCGRCRACGFFFHFPTKKNLKRQEVKNKTRAPVHALFFFSTTKKKI